MSNSGNTKGAFGSSKKSTDPKVREAKRVLAEMKRCIRERKPLSAKTVAYLNKIEIET